VFSPTTFDIIAVADLTNDINVESILLVKTPTKARENTNKGEAGY
jgi:hypothetical protein